MNSRRLERATSAPFRVMSEVMGEMASVLFEEYGLSEETMKRSETDEDPGSILQANYLLRRQLWELTRGKTTTFSSSELEVAKDIIHAISTVVDLSTIILSIDLKTSMFHAIVVQTLASKSARDDRAYLVAALEFIQIYSLYLGMKNISSGIEQLISDASVGEISFCHIHSEIQNWDFNSDEIDAVIARCLSAEEGFEKPLDFLLCIQQEEFI